MMLLPELFMVVFSLFFLFLLNLMKETGEGM